jgi:hypothetical protein
MEKTEQNRNTSIVFLFPSSASHRSLCPPETPVFSPGKAKAQEPEGFSVSVPV